MKSETITASVLVDHKKQLVGSRTVDKPETIVELQSKFSDDFILKMFWADYVIFVQAEIRRGTKSTTVKVEKTIFDKNNTFIAGMKNLRELLDKNEIDAEEYAENVKMLEDERKIKI